MSRFVIAIATLIAAGYVNPARGQGSATTLVVGLENVVEYQVDTSTFYSGSNGSIQVTSMETSRAQGVFNFELQSPINDPMVLIVTDGVFDVPVSVH